MSDTIPFIVEKNRVLVPVGEPCRFGCRYCYTRGGEVGHTHQSIETILSSLRQFACKTSFDIIQFGYDSDPFDHPERGIMMLRQLSNMRKHVNFSTKALLNGPILDALGAIRHSMGVYQNPLSALVSFSCWDSASSVEPHTPTPDERMLTVANLRKLAIPVFIAVRPVLPHIMDDEYERLVDEGIQAGCNGFILGPLYTNARGQFVRFIPPAALSNLPGYTGKVAWSPHSPLWTRYEDGTRLQRLLNMIERKGSLSFLSSIDALKRVLQAKTEEMISTGQDQSVASSLSGSPTLF